MKIIQYLPYSYHIHKWGLEKVAQTISDWINAEKDINIMNIASNIGRWIWEENNIYKDTIFIPSFDFVYNFPIPEFWKRDFWKQFTLIKKHKPDIIITHTRFFVQSLLGWLIAKRLWIKWIHIEHGSWFVTGYPWYIKTAAWIFDRTIWLRIFRQCDQIVTISQMHKFFIKKFTTKQPIVIYNPIDYQPQQKIKNIIPHIWFVGRLTPLKWVDLLLRALKKIQKRQRVCTIVGTGSEEKKLQQLAKDLDLANNITFIWADDRSNRLHKFDIFINPSYQEWVPTTVVEALMAKCIVVATDVGGTREINDKEDLILVESGQVDEIGQWLVLAFNRLDQSGDSYEKVMERFWMEKAIRNYQKILNH